MQFPNLWDIRFTLLLRSFTDNGVKYLLVGSMAKSHYYRLCEPPGDMDLLINPTIENARRVESAFRQRNYYHLLQLTLEKLALPSKRIEIFDCGVRVGDVLTPKANFNFLEAFSRGETEVVEGTTVRIASMCDLRLLDTLREQSEQLEDK